MRKSTKLMAGLGVVAGLGVALAPLATFADGQVGEDTLQITVKSACTITEDQGVADTFGGTYIGATSAPGDTQVPLTDGTHTDASVSFNCSENSKVQINAHTTGLAISGDSTAAGQIAPEKVYANYAGTNGMTIESAWGSTNYGALTGAEAQDGIKVAEGTAGNDSSSKLTFTVNGYKVDLLSNQKPGLYEGTVTYTFANL